LSHKWINPFSESLSEQNSWGEAAKVQGQLFILHYTYGSLIGNVRIHIKGSLGIKIRCRFGG
jgi:hypothetical protein